MTIPGMPEIKTLADFKASPVAQNAAQAANEADTTHFIQANGLDKYVGQNINGTPITQSGMLAVAHLGGNGGLQVHIWRPMATTIHRTVSVTSATICGGSSAWHRRAGLLRRLH